MRARGSSGQCPPGRRRWWRRREVQANPAETERFLDLAGFVDGRLDNNERERVAGLLAADQTAAADAAAAHGLLAATLPAVSDEIVARAVALVGPARSTLSGGEILAFPLRSPPPPRRAWPDAARWSGLAAAIAFACWLGFDLGGDLPGIASITHPSDELGAAELIDAAPLALRDPSEGSSI
jgi:hypothetical protein